MKLFKILFSRGPEGVLMLMGSPISLWLAALAWIVISLIWVEVML